MAKKPKKASPEGEAGEGGEGAAVPARKSKKKLIMIGAAALLLAGGGGGGWYFMHKKAGHEGEAGKEVAAPKKPPAFVDLKEMMVNLAGQNTSQMERTHFLKLKVALEIADPKLAAEIQPLLPRVEDSFQVYMRELRMSDVEGSAGVYRLKEELLRRVNIALHPAKVEAILFKELLVQ
jgi:flagellar FliL protein